VWLSVSKNGVTGRSSKKPENSNSNSNHLLIPNAHTTNIPSNICNMAIPGYHQDKIIYKPGQSIINMSKINVISSYANSELE